MTAPSDVSCEATADVSPSAHIPDYPEEAGIVLGMRGELHPRFAKLEEGISEFSFANLYLFRAAHRYRISRLPRDNILITGVDGAGSFFMLPFGVPESPLLPELFSRFYRLKCLTEAQVPLFDRATYDVDEDRDNFDYLFDREELAKLEGRKFHGKKNLVNRFTREYRFKGEPLVGSMVDDALDVLERWRADRGDPADYEAAREALNMTEELVLCGGVYYADSRPAGFTLGEELARGRMFVIHFEKAISGYTGIYQFINMSFSSILPEKYSLINREQDLGVEGLRRAKMSYRPVGFVRKYAVTTRSGVTAVS
jgi:hypothetical protein